MATDDHDGNERRKSRGDTGKPTRDARGRWRQGHCPNPKGRPKKKPKMLSDQSDIRIFGNTTVDIVANGQKETMDRRTALLNKMFESAMKGSVPMQRFLYNKFEKNDARLGAARAHYDRLMFDWVIDNKRGHDMPIEVELEILSLRTLLNYYFPGSFPINGWSENDNDDDG